MSRPRPDSIPSRVRRFAIRTIPSVDGAFARFVDAIAERQSPGAPRELEDRLRRLFPAAQVRLSALSHEPIPVWYVYREGRWFAPADTAWWRRDGVARVEASTDGRITTANAMAEAILRTAPGDLAGRHVADFLPPGTVDDARLLGRAVLDAGDAGGTMRARTADGATVACELHVQAVPTGFVAHLRPTHARVADDRRRLTDR